jgi:hypothetical protein
MSKKFLTIGIKGLLFLMTTFILLTSSPFVLNAAAAYLLVDDTSSSLNWTGTWSTVSDTKAIYDSVRRTCSTSERKVALTFSGSTITLFYKMVPDGGVAFVTIDGQGVDRLDMFSPETRSQVGKTYTVSTGSHTIVFDNNPGGANSRNCLYFDAFVVDIASVALVPGTYDNTTGLLVRKPSPSWYTYYASDAYYGSFYYTSAAEAVFRVNFVGDSISWYFTKSPNRGQATVTIDGQIMSNNCDASGYNCNIYWDLYNATVLRNQSLTFNGLGDGIHHLVVTNYGTNRFGSTDPTSNYIDVDRIDVSNSGSPSYNRLMAGAYADAWARARNPNYIAYDPINNCTNFSSQSLSAGTYPMIPGNYNRFNVNQWWYNDSHNPPNSNTWSATDWFYDFRATQPSDFTLVLALGNLKRGDLIILDTDGDDDWDHMRVVSGWQYASPFSSDYSGYGADFSPYHVYTLLVDQNTVDRWHVQWNYNFSINPLLEYEFIHVID